MNHDEHPNDSTLTQELRDALSELAAPERPPLAAITNRGRAHQRRRLAGFAGLGVTGAAAGTALALGLTGVHGAAPAGSTATIRTAAFTLTRNANGTDTLTLSMSQMLDPAALQRALAQHGIRALVKTGTYCSSNPAAPEPGSIGVLTVELANGTRVPKPAPAFKTPANFVPADTVTVINPAAMPSRTELFFGYFNSDHGLFFDLIYTSSYTCSNS
jgi:hypothetical protein